MKSARSAFGAAWLVLAPATSAAQNVDPAQYEHLKEPRIVERPDERMLQVEATGDPNEMGGQAFGLLFQLYFSSGAATGFTPPIPRARWPADLTTPPSQWMGRYGLPLPETVRALPQHTAPDGVSASITTWEYGEMGEILHVGPYDAEQPTIERLHAFLEAQGYETVGGHEEEYIRGPTMTGPGNPDEYLTILRYQVRRHTGSRGGADVGVTAAREHPSR